MAKGVNKVILIGNVGGDPETRYLPNGNAVTNITLATSESWKDKQTGQLQERTEWHRVSFFGKVAEIAGEYLRKGSQVYVEGRLQTRKWQDQQGQDRYTTEIVVDMGGQMQLLGGRPGGQQGDQQQGGQQGRPQQQGNQQQGRPQQGNQQQNRPQQGNQQQNRPQQGNQQHGGGYPQGGHQQQAPAPAPDYDSFDDDIPF